MPGRLPFLAALLLALSVQVAEASPFISRDRAVFERAIAAERPTFSPTPGVIGVTVPHHLLAADLIARGFWAASAGRYDRVILLAPDHFRAVKGAFATSAEALPTPFGAAEADRAAVAGLLASPLFEPHDLIRDEHGVMAVAPFIEAFFPDAEIVPVVASIYAREADWRAAADLLAPLVDDRTLVVQSTDYSHHLPVAHAVRRDQEVLTSVATAERDAIPRLLQPAHMDSLASQYIQMALQARRGAEGVVVANRNSVEYGAAPAATTSYVATVYLRDPAQGGALRYDDQQVLYIGGDTLLGRYFQPALLREGAVDRIAARVRAATHGAPLLVNLEGVMLDEPPVGRPPDSHVMLTAIALPILKRLNVVGASLANNHSFDFGMEGARLTEEALRAEGVAAFDHGRPADIGPVRVLALNFNGDRAGAQPLIDAAEDLDFVCALDAAPPVIAFVHWGAEYTADPAPLERAAAQRLSECGVAVIAGAHSHMRSDRILGVGGGESQLVFSLGNFLFDQRRPGVSGALLEVRVFRQGTVATRLVPIPNLFELALD